MDFIKPFYEKNFLEDDRSPALAFDLAGYHVEMKAPCAHFFGQVALILWIQMMIGSLLGAVMYYGIVAPRRDAAKNSSGLTSTGLLVGYGFVIPVALGFPFYAINTLDIRNGGLRMGCNSIAMTITLRCLEAMHGFVPSEDSQSLWDYVVSVGFILRPRVKGSEGDKSAARKIPITSASLIQSVKKHVGWILAFAVAFHLTMGSDFWPFPMKDDPREVLVTFDPGLLYNTFVQAAMKNMILTMSFAGVAAFAGILTGYEIDDRSTDFPMYFSSSVSDFWGRRWNNMVHADLKRGVYKPVRWLTGNRTLASVAAFCMSGLLHEYVWEVMFFVTDQQALEAAENGQECCSSCYCDVWFGRQLIFFGWNGVLIGLEYLVGDKVSAWTANVPSLLRSHLIVLMALPVGHLFTADLTNARYYLSIQQMLPMISVTRG